MEDLYFRWGFTFLRADSRLSYDDRHYLMQEATEMYLKNEEERQVKTDTLEGRLYTKGQHDSLGSFGGQRFDAEIELNLGKAKVRFLVNEQTNTSQSGGMVN